MLVLHVYTVSIPTTSLLLYGYIAMFNCCLHTGIITVCVCATYTNKMYSICVCECVYIYIYTYIIVLNSFIVFVQFRDFNVDVRSSRVRSTTLCVWNNVTGSVVHIGFHVGRGFTESTDKNYFTSGFVKLLIIFIIH